MLKIPVKRLDDAGWSSGKTWSVFEDSRHDVKWQPLLVCPFTRFNLTIYPSSAGHMHNRKQKAKLPCYRCWTMKVSISGNSVLKRELLNSFKFMLFAPIHDGPFFTVIMRKTKESCWGESHIAVRKAPLSEARHPFFSVMIRPASSPGLE